MKRFLIFILLCTSIIACNEEQNNIRILSNYKLKEISHFGHLKGHIIRLWADSLIYISDAPDFKVSVYNYQNELVKVLGKKGPAPWEFGSIWGFARDSNDSTYWVHDYQKKLLKNYNYYTDSMISSCKVETRNNVQYMGEGNFLMPRMRKTDNNLLLSVLDVNTKKIIKDFNLSEKANLESNDYGHHMVLHGNFAKSLSNNTIYACENAGIFFKINMQTDSITVHKYIGDIPTPKNSIHNGMVLLEPKIYAPYSVAVDEQCIYFLAGANYNKRPEMCRAFYIDIYDLESCKYKNSIKVEKREGDYIPKIIAKYKDKIILAYNDYSVVIYQYEN